MKSNFIFFKMLGRENIVKLFVESIFERKSLIDKLPFNLQEKILNLKTLTPSTITSDNQNRRKYENQQKLEKTKFITINKYGNFVQKMNPIITNMIYKTPKKKIKNSNSLSNELSSIKKLSQGINKEQIFYRKKCDIIKSRISNLKKQEIEINKQIEIRNNKKEEIEKIIREKQNLKKLLTKVKKEKENNIKEKKEIIQTEHMLELYRVKSAIINNKTQKQINYQNCKTENKKDKLENQLKQNLYQQKLNAIVKKRRENSYSSNHINYNEIHKNYEIEINFINEAKFEVDKLKKNYEELSKKENEYFKKLQVVKLKNELNKQLYISSLSSTNLFQHKNNKINKNQNLSQNNKDIENKPLNDLKKKKSFSSRKKMMSTNYFNDNIKEEEEKILKKRKQLENKIFQLKKKIEINKEQKKSNSNLKVNIKI